MDCAYTAMRFPFLKFLFRLYLRLFDIQIFSVRFWLCGLAFLSQDSSLKKQVCGDLEAVKQKAGVGHRHMSSEQIH